MEPRFLLSIILFVVLLNPHLVMNMVIGYVLGSVVRSNYARLKKLLSSKKNENDEEDEGQITQMKNPFEDVDADVLQHLKTLGLDTKVEGDDLEYLQRLWESISSKK
ncbi:U4 protein [Faba bean necrotic stunt virus]|uniref:U4 protein n=1 Tax=Faba bean necrotic stunt virus TaxID=283824 RepID=D2WHU9_9VIRU|nr:U4 protein [Faba bean necrotic stunt virus]